MTRRPPRIGVMGAGSIGCYIGGRLQAAGFDAVLVGRASLRDEVAEHGLRITDFSGSDVRIAAGDVAFATDASALSGARFVLVTVKGPATGATAREIAPHLDADTVVVSFQNGVRNADIIRAALPRHRVLAGMVPFNVVRKDAATFHRGTSGDLVIERSSDGIEDDLIESLAAAGMPTARVRNVVEVQWGKLVLNLNNPLNALSGVPLLEQVSDPLYRRVLAAMMSEALTVLRAARIRPEVHLPLPLFTAPWVLRLPNFLFRRVAKRLIDIDPEARSSMWEDLERRRPTEIDSLNGEIVRLAERVGRRAAVNQRVVELVTDADGKKSGSPRMPAAVLARAVGIA